MSEPRDGKFTRKGEKHGRSLSPGERAKHWASACKEGWPVVLGLIGLLGYTNAAEIKQFVSKPVPTVEDVTSTGNFEDQTRAALQSIKDKFKEQDQRLKDLEKRDVTDQAEIREEINKLKEWHK